LSLRPGDIFADRYQVQRLIGEGDRKRTYLARDSRMDRVVALSLVKPEAAASDPQGTYREVRMLGSVGTHDNIVSVFEMGLEGPVEYLVFEHLSGGTLREYLDERRARDEMMSVEEILRFARQLCRGLSHLHQSGILHRDVSPGNIWLDERNTLHLGDFDSAIHIDTEEGVRPLTTESYASPEERSGGKLDERSDLYSLGAVLYEMATGSTPKAMVGVESELARPSSTRSDLPTSFDDLAYSLLAPSPDDRPGSANDVLTLLGAIRQASNIESLIPRGEGEHIEFKASLLKLYGETPLGLADPEGYETAMRRELEKTVAKTTAAFLNSGGGTLLIGVADDGTVVGIEPDFPLLSPSFTGRQDADTWLLHLNGVIEKYLGADIWACIHVSLVPHQGVTVASVACPSRTTDTWFLDGRDDEGRPRETFFVRASNSSEPLSPSEAARYIRERWPV